MQNKNTTQLDEIKRRVNELKAKNTSNFNKQHTHEALNSNAFYVATDLLAGTIVGLVMGLFFDNIFDSQPICLIIFLILGIIGSFKLIWNRSIK